MIISSIRKPIDHSGARERALHRCERSRKSATWLAMCFIFCAPHAIAQGLGRVIDGDVKPAANASGPNLKDIGIEQRLNQDVPFDLRFRDESGQPVTLARYFRGKPVVLALVYYKCAMLCPELLKGIAHSLSMVAFKAGTDYDVVAVSFDPRDTPEIAASKKLQIVKELGNTGAGRGWHFLTGEEIPIRQLTQAVGFRYKWDQQTKQFLHVTAVVVLTPQGRISKYFYGVDFRPADLRLGLVEASHNRIGTLADVILLYCCKYDAITGKYDWLVARILAIAGVLIILALGTFIAVMFRLGPKRNSTSVTEADLGAQ